MDGTGVDDITPKSIAKSWSAENWDSLKLVSVNGPMVGLRPLQMGLRTSLIRLCARAIKIRRTLVDLNSGGNRHLCTSLARVHAVVRTWTRRQGDKRLAKREDSKLEAVDGVRLTFVCATSLF